MNVTLTPTHLDVRLSVWEKLGGLTTDHHIARERIAAAEVDPAPMHAIRGRFKAGLRLPGVRFVCWTWHPMTFWSISHDAAALRVTVRGGRLRQLVLSTPDAAELARALGSRP